jgi:hypothetical protein
VRDPARRELDELRGYLSGLPPQTAVAAMRHFLDSKQDAPNGLDFAVGGDGFLTAAPSLAPHRSSAELQMLAGLFPNANFMVAQNLVTSLATPITTPLRAATVPGSRRSNNGGPITASADWRHSCRRSDPGWRGLFSRRDQHP